MRFAAGLLVVTLAAAPAIADGLPEWISGSWELDANGRHVEEHWTGAAAGLMVGMGKTVSAKGKAEFEFLRIGRLDGKIAYIAQPQGRPPTTFLLKNSSDSNVVFENPEHDFPQRVLYWRDGGKLCARIEGTTNGKPASEEWCFTRMAAVPH